ncbi:ATPase family AAA domain-containing protein 5 isoform X3 [Ornithorhynchus anatinus]|uniref:ATPase family AAA domain-containing protein 5 isoform X3 n=1 Tax=Ornithorhynchus anatinus TaxID=9258 RepID=UPI0010A7A4CA|nr:ATPase family AAA domain-containing protein 5 isoform X3 [Ornithorhynchus anatinus]
MVGGLTLAAPPPGKDGDLQPCKKQRKDDDESSCKTIIKYLSPIGKTGDKVFSSPKSNNILDYFKKTPPASEHACMAKESKVKSSKLLNVDDGKECQTPSRPSSNSTSGSRCKRRGKRINLCKQLNDSKPENASTIEIISDDSGENSLSNGFIGSTDSSFLAQKGGEERSESNQDPKPQSIIVPCQKDSKKANSEQSTVKSNRKKPLKRKPKSDLGLPESLSWEKELEEPQASSPKAVESMNMNRPTEAVQLNESTVTVSFEEFLKSQRESRLDPVSAADRSKFVNSDAAKERAKNDNTSDPENCDGSLPLKTVTVLAQIHSIPPKSVSGLKAKKTKKIASIFLKQKEYGIENSPPELEVEQNEQTIQKRKSNVVIREEELELAVLEAAGPEVGKPKCTVEERQQFMKAFRQPSSDSIKSGVKKSSEKVKEVNEKPLKEEGEEEGANKTENQKLQKESVDFNSQPQPGKGDSTNGRTMKLRRKGKKASESTEIKNEEKPEEDNEKKTPNEGKNPSDTEATKNQDRVRRSLRRQKTASQSSMPFTFRNTDSKDSIDDSPFKASTPKASGRWARTNTRPGTCRSKGIGASKRALSDSLVKVSAPELRGNSSRRRRSSNPVRISISDTASEGAPDEESPVKISTPKATSTASGKSNLYVAELITVPSDSKSPIRMKFTRISSPKKGEATDEDFIPKRRKARRSKNISKAKQLIEKAKAIHHKSKVNEVSTPLRRSSRNQTLLERKNRTEAKDSIIIIDTNSSSSPSPKKNARRKQKALPCLNDVLGKKTTNTKFTKNVPVGKVKVAPLFLAKRAQKTPGTGTITVFDESSQDTSENSQDDKQFKAKREFLRSGLPDSLKRHIAKKAAALETYLAISSCFPTVVHVQQKDDCSHLWNLTPPSCALLTKLRKLSAPVPDITKRAIALGEFSVLDIKPRNTNSAVVLSGSRPDFTEELRKHLLKEIQSSNSDFPVKSYFMNFLKKRTEHQALFENQSKQVGNQRLKFSDNQKESKRKRTETEHHKSKRRKPSSDASGTVEALPIMDRSNINNSPGLKLDSSKARLSRVTRKKPAAQENAARNKKADLPQDPDVLIIDKDEGSSSEVITISDSGSEDMLWTEKYQPQNSSELIGNRLAIKKLHSWLKDWKKRAEFEEKNVKGKRDDKQQDLSDSIDFKGDDSDEEESPLCNTVLITGPTGVGKTAAVYACAQELGFKVFEVNASSQRSGRQILSQLKEATQSHQVDKKGVNSHKPCFFNSYSLGKSPKKSSSPKKVMSPRKPPLSPRGAGPKRGLPPKTLANYFKVSSKQKNNEGMTKSQENNNEICSSEEKQGLRTKATNTPNSNIKEFETEEPNRKSATSLILFEEVDVIFDEDAGFLNAIKTFMATTKRPVILTTSDPAFSLMFDGFFEEINFKTPCLINVASFLQVLCLAENLRTDVKDFVTLLKINNCDIRRSVLYLQFWIRSGGGVPKEKSLSFYGGNDRNVQVGSTEDTACFTSSERDPADLPMCDTGSVETFLGLKNIFHPSEDLFSFLKHKTSTREEWDKLIQFLTEFQARNVDFLHSNLEFVLPLPVLTVPEPKCAGISSGTSSEKPLLKDSKPLIDDEHSKEISTLKNSKKIKYRKKITSLDDSDLFDTELNYLDERSSPLIAIPTKKEEENKDGICLETKDQHKSVEVNSASIPPKTLAEKKCSTLVSHCLNSLTEFLDSMSFIDSVLTGVREQKEFCQNEEFNWTNGKLKNGLCDEFSQENSDWFTSQNTGELKAVVEALSFSKCSADISQALETSLASCKKLGKDPSKELALHVSERRNEVYFSQSAANLEAQKRLAIIKSVFSSRSLLNLGNRQEIIVDYLPTLRSICRTEKSKEQGKSKRRFLHYFEGIHLDLSKDTVNCLAASFP